MQFTGEEPSITSFGVRSFVEAGESVTVKENLQKLLFELFANTVQLLRFMEDCPGRIREKLEDLDTIIFNILYILNSLRRKQALLNIMKHITKSIGNRDTVIRELKQAIASLAKEVHDIAHS